MKRGIYRAPPLYFLNLVFAVSNSKGYAMDAQPLGYG